MPNSILPQDHDGQELFNAISSFFSRFKVGNLLRKCNAQKETGVPVLQIFKYKLCNVFADRSMYMRQKTGSYREVFSKKTFDYWLFQSTLPAWGETGKVLYVNMELDISIHSPRVGRDHPKMEK